MSGRKIIFAAIALYAVVLGCVVWPGDKSQSQGSGIDEKPVPGLVTIKGLHPYCGVALQLQRVDWVENYKKTIDTIADDGADTVSLEVDARQENASSTQMYVDMRKTMTVPQLTEIINHAKLRKLRVMLMPIVLLDKPATDKEWRGTLAPTNWHEWFDSYRDMIEHYARIANDTGVDVLVVGSELVSSEQPAHLDEWVTTIKAVRDIYKGQLTYSSNWDRYEKVPLWKYLDLVGMNSYWTLGDDSSVSVEDIKAHWRDIQDKIFKWQAKSVHKPIILTEAGWCSLSNAAKDPWDYTQVQLPADNELQRKLYQAFFESWWGKPQLAGFMIWEMHPGDDDTGKGYTPAGKPAEQVLREWMKKPRWDILSFDH